MAKYTIIIEKDKDGWFFSEVVGLPGCHTQAKTIEELKEKTKEAIQAYLEDEPVDSSTEFVRVEEIEV